MANPVVGIANRLPANMNPAESNVKFPRTKIITGMIFERFAGVGREDASRSRKAGQLLLATCKTIPVVTIGLPLAVMADLSQNALGLIPTRVRQFLKRDDGNQETIERPQNPSPAPVIRREINSSSSSSSSSGSREINSSSSSINLSSILFQEETEGDLGSVGFSNGERHLDSSSSDDRFTPGSSTITDVASSSNLEGIDERSLFFQKKELLALNEFGERVCIESQRIGERVIILQREHESLKMELVNWLLKKELESWSNYTA